MIELHAMVANAYYGFDAAAMGEAILRPWRLALNTEIRDATDLHRSVEINNGSQVEDWGSVWRGLPVKQRKRWERAFAVIVEERIRT